MVFHYTNFVFETNAWWLRRFRPPYLLSIALIGSYIGGRYYFFGKNAVNGSYQYTDEENQARAILNQRDYGYNTHYQPTLERSMKKQLYADPNYEWAINYCDRYTGDTRSLAQIMEDEENWTSKLSN